MDHLWSLKPLMITKLILKILFKATLPLVAVAGIASYALYAAGGDPMSVLKQVGGGLGERVSALAGSAGSSIDSARKKTASTFTNNDPTTQQTLYRWKDANGVTHFSNAPPEEGQTVESVRVNPNQNLISAVPSPRQKASTNRVNHSSSNQSPDDAEMEPMPGMAGIMGRGLKPSELFGHFTQSQSGNNATNSLPAATDGDTNTSNLVDQFKKSQDSRLRQIP